MDKFSFVNADKLGSSWEIDSENWKKIEDGTLYVTLTYVPEASTYAVIFGALAFVFVAYSRKRK